MKLAITAALAVFLFLIACSNNKNNTQGEWIKGSEEEKIKITERQFRGFDMAMVETGYRYQELYWAGKDQNWGYANYQVEKVKIAVENGLQRRPKRARSAEHFLTDVLPQIQKSVDAKDSAEFNNRFLILTSNCNSCHAAENVSFFTVKTPTERQSPIRK